MLNAELFAQSKAFFIQPFEFGGVLFHSCHLHRSFGTDAYNLSFILKLFHQFQLLTISLNPSAQSYAQTWVLLIYKCGILWSRPLGR